MLSAAQCGSWLTLRELALDELRRHQYFGATAAPAKSAVRRIRHRQAGAQEWRCRTCDGERRSVGIPSARCVASRGETRLVQRAVVTSIATVLDKVNDSRGKSCAWKLNSHCRKNKTTGEKPDHKAIHTIGAVRKANDGAISVKPELAFDVCWEVYKGAKEVIEAKRGISALKFEEATKFSWRPDNRPRLNEWVADFALAGKAALEGPDWASRMLLFRVYYLGALRQSPAFCWLEREKLGELDRGDSPPLRPGVAAPWHVSTAKIFYFGSVAGVVVSFRAGIWRSYSRMSGSPTRSILLDSEGAIRVFVARR